MKNDLGDLDRYIGKNNYGHDNDATGSTQYSEKDVLPELISDSFKHFPMQSREVCLPLMFLRNSSD